MTHRHTFYNRSNLTYNTRRPTLKKYSTKLIIHFIMSTSEDAQALRQSLFFFGEINRLSFWVHNDMSRSTLRVSNVGKNSCDRDMKKQREMRLDEMSKRRMRISSPREASLVRRGAERCALYRSAPHDPGKFKLDELNKAQTNSN